MDIFLKQLIQFYSSDATNLHHLTSHSTTVLPHKMEIVFRPQICNVTSPYVLDTHTGAFVSKKALLLVSET